MTNKSRTNLLTFLLYLTTTLKLKPTHSALNEDDRLKEYHARKYTFPPKEYIPNTAGWKSLMERRMKQISTTIHNSNEKYNAWLVTMSSAVVIQNYTKYGWGLTRAPEDVIQELRDSLYTNMPFARNEHVVEVLDTSPRSSFIDQSELNSKIANRLLKMHEDWSGIELVPSIAYGLRLYQNNSGLLMHTDKPNSHVISCILHVGRSPDAEPWPIAIEDYTGTTNEVYLEPGDMLFYESSKCLHGRTRTFIGSWYTSLFVHYRPKWDWDMERPMMEKHYAVPPDWNWDGRFRVEEGEEVEDLVIVGTGFKEPSCEGNWCALKDSRKWYGPALPGVVIDPDYMNSQQEEL